MFSFIFLKIISDSIASLSPSVIVKQIDLVVSSFTDSDWFLILSHFPSFVFWSVFSLLFLPNLNNLKKV